MTLDLRNLIPEYVLGILPEDDRQRLASALEQSAELREEVRLAREAIAKLGDTGPREAPPSTRTRLLATLASPDRFRAFFPLLRGWLDLSDDGIRDVLATMDAGTAWKRTPFPGVRHFDFQAGPAALGTIAGFVLMPPGGYFPKHRHLGTERSLILEGTLLLDGRPRHVGDIVESPPGSVHDFRAAEGRHLVFLVVRDEVTFAV